ncbi:MAG TPA: RagB/SusD family nutrient uptake outer membrane protein [Bacteroidales bacterium]|nr:RagB/SusD family nutrient uptake outer membrane protein [Bacteroidales bacterium]
MKRNKIMKPINYTTMKEYIYRFSKRFLLFAGILLLFFPSCSEDVLEEKPLDFLAPENAYNTLPGIKQGITGLHFSTRQRWFYGTNQPVITVMRGLGTDIAFHGEDPNSNMFLCNYVTNITSSNTDYRNIWIWNYELIQRANVLIEGIENADPAIWTSEAQKNAYKAEAMFFRAFAYRFLVSFYGDVPLVTEVIRSAKTDFVRTPKAQVYALMEEDLLFGTTNLPVPGSEEAPGRITQGAAWHMLSECYLNQGKFQLAASAATKVISGYKFALMKERFGDRQNVVFGTGDVYYDLFAYGNQNLGINTESIWVIQIEPPPTTGGASVEGNRAFGPAYFRLGNTPDGKKAFRGEFVNGAYTGYSDTLGRPVAWIHPTNYVAYDIWRSDWNNDIRNAKHNIKRDFYYDSPGSAYHKKRINLLVDYAAQYAAGTRDAMRDSCQYIYPYWMKFADPCHYFTDPARSGGGNHHKDLYAIRLAETLLLRAEAYVGLGQPDLAAADINLIRSRSNATPVNPANVNLNYILDERARELYGEENRFITLRRMGKLFERVRALNNNPKNPGLNIQNYHVLFPIPQSQIDLNIGADFPQNAGYPSL